jgi:hypothetical protein
MYHDLLGRASFWSFLLAIDRDLAERARQKNCSCGGRLHRADYPRKPRGGKDLSEEYGYRLSFCCDRDGCRKRVTPASVRFLGPKVYLGAVVVLIAAMQQGPSPKRVAELSELIGADRRTIARWRVFWTEHFPQTSFWKVARGAFRVAVEAGRLPLALVEAFLQPEDSGRSLGRLLSFLSPITVTGGLATTVS